MIRKEFMELKDNELLSIKGGGYGVVAGIGAAIAFLISVLNGFVNPSKCGS